MALSISRDRFCLNRKVAPTLSMESFFQVTKACGLSKVEVRNDLPGGKILDDLSIAEFNALTEKYGIEVLTINALYPFNYPEERENVTKKAKEMLEIAQGIHCKSIIMCPYNEPDTRSDVQKEIDTVDSLRYITNLFNQYGVNGLVEPLGFTQSSLRFYTLAQEMIKTAGSSFKVVLDTFHHHLAELPVDGYAKTVDVTGIGLVHLSGVEDLRATNLLTDEERIMLSTKDVLKSKEQVIELEKLGYKGIYSFEPFASALNNWNSKDVEKAVNESIDFICK